MKAVITTVGKDRIGILAMMANACADNQVNVLDVSQTILDGIFTMTMVVDTEALSVPLSDFASYLQELGDKNGLVIRLMNKEIFDSMHRV
ncbi:MAG: ACT domain-containing protein [Erysipelotrichaceae bacterium]|nr:ACT domain-containing protein [Erysipelotrichaceae bacterium]